MIPLEKTWAEKLLGAGVTTSDGKIKFKTLTRNNETESPIHYTGITTENKHVAISFGSKDAPMGKQQVIVATQEKPKYGSELLLLIGMGFDPEAKDMILSMSNIIGAESNSDLWIPELKTSEKDVLFVEIGRPRFDIVEKDESIVVKMLRI